jgi:purine-binding chemotaxis protein CheW
MDFLKIRKKAKERARDRGAADGRARPPGASAADSGPAASPPADAPVVTDQDLLEGALAARLQGQTRGDPSGALAAADQRFTTWRPGSGAPPTVPLEPERPPVPTAQPEDFTLVAPRPLSPGAPALGTHEALALAPLAGDLGPPPGPVRPVPVPADPLDDFFFREDEAAPELPELAPAERDEAPVVLAREELLTFLLGAEEYAVAIERVREVVRSPPITEVPRAPTHILGVVTVRGEVMAVIDPRRRLGLPAAHPAEGEGKIVIVDAGEGPCGLHVDRVASVVRLRPGSIEPCPQGIAGQRSEVLAGIGREGDRLFTVLDLPALLRRAPSRAEGRAAQPLAQLCTFRIGGEDYAIDIMRVREIIHPLPITPVPRAPAFVEGVIRLRGDVIPVIDVRKRLALPATPETRKSRFLVVNVAGRRIALVVDEVREVLRLPRSEIRPAPSLGTIGPRFFLGVCGGERSGSALRLLLNVKALLDPTVVGEVDAARAQAEASRRA